MSRPVQPSRLLTALALVFSALPAFVVGHQLGENAATAAAMHEAERYANRLELTLRRQVWAAEREAAYWRSQVERRNLTP